MVQKMVNQVWQQKWGKNTIPHGLDLDHPHFSSAAPCRSHWDESWVLGGSPVVFSWLSHPSEKSMNPWVGMITFPDGKMISKRPVSDSFWWFQLLKVWLKGGCIFQPIHIDQGGESLQMPSTGLLVSLFPAILKTSVWMMFPSRTCAGCLKLPQYSCWWYQSKKPCKCSPHYPNSVKHNETLAQTPQTPNEHGHTPQKKGK